MHILSAQQVTRCKAGSTSAVQDRARWPQIRDCLPNAGLVDLIGDPLGIVASRHGIPFRRGAADPVKAFHGPLTLRSYQQPSHSAWHPKSVRARAIHTCSTSHLTFPADTGPIAIG